MVSTRGVLPDLWLEIRLEILSTPWCHGFYPVVSCLVCGLKLDWKYCPLWCRGVHPMVSWFPPCGVLPGLWLKIRLEMLPFVVSWCRGFHLVVLWCTPRGVMVSTPWCHGVLPGFWLKIRLEMLSSVVSWFPPPVVSWCLAWFVAWN